MLHFNSNLHTYIEKETNTSRGDRQYAVYVDVFHLISMEDLFIKGFSTGSCIFSQSILPRGRGRGRDGGRMPYSNLCGAAISIHNSISFVLEWIHRANLDRRRGDRNSVYVDALWTILLKFRALTKFSKSSRTFFSIDFGNILGTNFLPARGVIRKQHARTRTGPSVILRVANRQYVQASVDPERNIHFPF